MCGLGVGIFGGATNNTIGGTTSAAANVISGNKGDGLNISGAGTGQTVVEGNLIGVNSAGSAALPNVGSGVGIFGGATNNTIGGTTSAAANVVSGNDVNGIFVSGAGSSANLIEGNLVGVNSAGDTAILNKAPGILIIAGAAANTVGGTVAGAGNVISGNNSDGVQIVNTGSSNNLVEGNDIGVTKAGAAITNNVGAGMDVSAGATNNTIGGTLAGAGNVISGNTEDGLDIAGVGTTGNLVEGNAIGVNPAGRAAVPNAGSGIGIFGGATNNTVGGTTAAAANVVSGNSTNGIVVINAGTSSNLIEGNLIGVNAGGNTAVLNKAPGVLIGGGATGNTLGGTAAGAANVISGNSSFGVQVNGTGTTTNLVEGNDIGVTAAGAPIANDVGNGLALSGGATNNTIGGTTPAAANVVSGNQGDGMDIFSAGTSNNLVEGNDIGVNAAGNAAVPNGGYGISVFNGASSNTIGGTTSGAQNVVSGNSFTGVNISGAGSNDNLVEGNILGVDSTGTIALGNNGDAVFINGGAASNTIGGTTAAAANVMSGNTLYGIHIQGAGTSHNVVEGNFIGTDKTGSIALGNTKQGVLIDTGATADTIGGTGAARGTSSRGTPATDSTSPARGPIITSSKGTSSARRSTARSRSATPQAACRSSRGRPATPSAAPPPARATSFRATRHSASKSPARGVRPTSSKAT